MTDGVRLIVNFYGIDNRFIDGLPTALMKPFSGSGARAMMIDTMQSHGADSFAGRLASVVQGSTETTFYVLAVYFGAVNIKQIRHAAACGIIADIGGITAAILVTYWFFG
jgi:spore maturation protein SpmB